MIVMVNILIVNKYIFYLSCECLEFDGYPFHFTLTNYALKVHFQDTNMGLDRLFRDIIFNYVYFLMGLKFVPMIFL